MLLPVAHTACKSIILFSAQGGMLQLDDMITFRCYASSYTVVCCLWVGMNNGARWWQPRATPQFEHNAGMLG